MTSATDVTAAIIERRGKFLVTRRNAGKHLAGYWEFPGGKRRLGETWKRCLIRELAEELGLEISVGKRLNLIEHRYNGRTVRIAFYRCQIVGGRVRAREGQLIRWVTRSQLRRLKFPAADVLVFQQL